MNNTPGLCYENVYEFTFCINVGVSRGWALIEEKEGGAACVHHQCIFSAVVRRPSLGHGIQGSFSGVCGLLSGQCSRAEQRELMLPAPN